MQHYYVPGSPPSPLRPSYGFGMGAILESHSAIFSKNPGELEMPLMINGFGLPKRTQRQFRLELRP